MGAGAIIPTLLSISASATEAIIYGENPAQFSIELGPWTPPQYSQPAVTVLTVESTTSDTTGQPTSSAINYVFDAVFRILHRRVLKKTSHPVLTGPNMSDHAYLEPARVTLEIGMSDAMASFSDGVWVGAATKSISAWQIIKSLQQSKTLITLTTRLDTYQNMLIMEAQAPDDNRTGHSLKATVVLEELISGTVTSVAAQSAIPQTTNQTSGGVVPSVAPNAGQAAQYSEPSDQYPELGTDALPLYPMVPGAGSISSNNWSKYQVQTGNLPPGPTTF